jgi:hypothetical protein
MYSKEDMFHYNNNKIIVFLSLNLVQSLTTQSSCFGIHLIMYCDIVMLFGCTGNCSNKELPGYVEIDSSSEDAQRPVHISAHIPVHLLTVDGAKLQHTPAICSFMANYST